MFKIIDITPVAANIDNVETIYLGGGYGCGETALKTLPKNGSWDVDCERWKCSHSPTILRLEDGTLGLVIEVK